MAYPKLEYKYLFPAEACAMLRSRIKEMCDVDSFAAREADEQYTIRSVYFDTKRLDAYEQKREGERVRRKFRIRTYNAQQADSIAYLEIKSKQGAFLTKHRAPVPYDALSQVFTGRGMEDHADTLFCDGAGADAASRWMYHYMRMQLQPVVLITYEREPFIGRYEGDLRVTLDKHIRASMFPALTDIYTEEGLRPTLCNFAILEVKFTRGVPRWLRRVIHDFGLNRMALSKYTICIDSLYPEVGPSANSRMSFKCDPNLLRPSSSFICVP
ncbi:MAG: polyphosphate polymerase domain-containing protein [Bacteroidota bacterium]|nr:polyphosphate polymerase domain-containing protein [Bacteroidota bacterium]